MDDGQFSVVYLPNLDHNTIQIVSWKSYEIRYNSCDTIASFFCCLVQLRGLLPTEVLLTKNFWQVISGLADINR